MATLMDSTLNSSASVPSILPSYRPATDSVSGSGSYQGHLSSIGSFHRVRTTSAHVQQNTTDEKFCPHVLESGLAGATAWQHRPGPSAKHFLTDPLGFFLDDMRRLRNGHFWRARTLLTLYCCTSVLFMSLRVGYLFRAVFGASVEAREHRVLTDDSTAYTYSVSPLTNMSMPQLLSMAFLNLPPSAHVDPFILHGRHHHSQLTACFWIEDVNVEAALATASAWPGPVSLVVVTTIQPNTTDYEILFSRIVSNPLGANVSLHLLRVQSIGSSSFNNYLNMARFFAQTSQVILFPEGLPAKCQEKCLYDLPTRTSHPVILSNVTQKTFSPKSITPVALPKDHPIWCTERFYLFGSRTLDWEDCLWQMWLESAGDMSSIVRPNLFDGVQKTVFPVSPQALKARRRWSSKYRSEICIFSLKRSQAIDPLTKIEKRRMQWRKRFCRETAETATDFL